MKRLYNDDNINELNEAIEIYFDGCTEEGITPGFAGLAYALGFCERRSLNDYAGHKDSTSTPIKRAMLRIEASYESQLANHSCTGAIFALKNRGWSDKQEVEHSGSVVYLPPGADDKGF